ncbi:hypothetical protein [Nitrospirillum amazonense]|uniref:hypothetical protein n=1 Tax=Nitrospirillum amazonense TaxID=28077 RepID=UPI002412BED6|nr:hypothetical protein [Nitrospirillum amazonense]MDG3444528.1 hypothetical protein [Nitrospirillum amazonense]
MDRTKDILDRDALYATKAALVRAIRNINSKSPSPLFLVGPIGSGKSLAAEEVRPWMVGGRQIVHIRNGWQDLPLSLTSLANTLPLPGLPSATAKSDQSSPFVAVPSLQPANEPGLFPPSATVKHASKGTQGIVLVIHEPGLPATWQIETALSGMPQNSILLILLQDEGDVIQSAPTVFVIPPRRNAITQRASLQAD